MSETDVPNALTGKKPRKSKRELLASVTNLVIAEAMMHCKTLRGQLELLSIMERLLRKGNKGRLMPIHVVRPVVDFLRPETEATNGGKAKAQKPGK